MKIYILCVLLLFPLLATAGEMEDWLIDAAADGNLIGLNQLIARGADVNAKTKNGRTALKYAAREGHTVIVKALIDKGANVDARNEYGQTALMLTAIKGHTETVKALIEAGAYVDTRDADG